MLFLLSKHYNILQSFQLKFFKINNIFKNENIFYLKQKMFTGERCGVYPDTKDEKSRKLEFSKLCHPVWGVCLMADLGTSVINILNSLEQMNYKVVTSGSFVASQSFNNNKVRSEYRKVSLSTRSYLTNTQPAISSTKNCRTSHTTTTTTTTFTHCF